MEPLSGNSADKTSFHQMIAKVKAFEKQIDLATPFEWIADSALYTTSNLLNNNDYIWTTRVPESIKEARILLETPCQELANWQEAGPGYQISSQISTYGGIKQRWLVVYSQASCQRETKTLEGKLAKQETSLKKALWHLANKVFEDQKAGIEAIKKIIKSYSYFIISYQIVAIQAHVGRGKPKKDSTPQTKGYQVVGSYKANQELINRYTRRKGRFILATNQLDTEKYPDIQLLSSYKEQSKVERRFRFLKDPLFMVDDVFLKLPRRIEAFMMVMCLTLLVYNVGQYKLREK